METQSLYLYIYPYLQELLEEFPANLGKVLRQYNFHYQQSMLIYPYQALYLTLSCRIADTEGVHFQGVPFSRIGTTRIISNIFPP